MKLNTRQFLKSLLCFSLFPQIPKSRYHCGGIVSSKEAIRPLLYSDYALPPKYLWKLDFVDVKLDKDVITNKELNIYV